MPPMASSRLPTTVVLESSMGSERAPRQRAIRNSSWMPSTAISRAPGLGGNAGESSSSGVRFARLEPTSCGQARRSQKWISERVGGG